MTLGGFEDCLRSMLASESSAITRKIGKRRNIYAGGSPDENVYFLVSGQVKLVMHSPAGKECLLTIYRAGDFFGENCLSGIPRSETATAMSETVIKRVTGARFLSLLKETGLVVSFIRYLAVRLSEQQQMITNLATVDCEHRLAAALLRLCCGTGQENSLAQKISHQELAQMVGTTRPRVSEFMQKFRARGLIEMTPDSRILIRQRGLKQYLETCGLEPRLSAIAS